MVKIKKPYKVKCRSCGVQINIDLDLECVSTYERQMGMELEYEAICESECLNCGADILVRVQAWEYPVGVLNYQNVELEGVEEINGVLLETSME